MHAINFSAWYIKTGIDCQVGTFLVVIFECMPSVVVHGYIKIALIAATTTPAASKPPFKAMPTCEAAKAGASFTPSPTCRGINK